MHSFIHSCRKPTSKQASTHSPISISPPVTESLALAATSHSILFSTHSTLTNRQDRQKRRVSSIKKLVSRFFSFFHFTYLLTSFLLTHSLAALRPLIWRTTFGHPWSEVIRSLDLNSVDTRHNEDDTPSYIRQASYAAGAITAKAY